MQSALELPLTASAESDEDALARSTIWSSRAASGAVAAASDTARRRRLLVALSLSQSVVTLLGAGLVSTLAPAALGDLGPVLALAGAGFLVAYAASRRTMLRASALAIVVTQLVTPPLVALDGSGSGKHMLLAGWLALAMLTANTTLGSFAGLLVGACAIAEVIAVGALVEELPAMAVAEGALFLGSATAAAVAYARHQAGMEAARQTQLESRNVELEGMRASLERRVGERTLELATRAQELAGAYTALEQRQALLLRTEKMAAVGRLTAGFAHELATPMSASLAAVQVLGDLTREYSASIGDDSVGPEDHHAIAAEMGTTLRTLGSATERAMAFVRQIRAHTRDPGRRAAERFDLGPVIGEAVDLLRYVARTARVELVVDVPATRTELVGLPSSVNQAVTNLLQNAIDAAAERGSGGRVALRVGRSEREAVVRIEDNGPGIPDDVVARMFEPLFTTKPHGKGTGLGLPIVREAVEEFRGRVDVETRVGLGTTFVVRLPLAG